MGYSRVIVGLYMGYSRVNRTSIEFVGKVWRLVAIFCRKVGLEVMLEAGPSTMMHC